MAYYFFFLGAREGEVAPPLFSHPWSHTSSSSLPPPPPPKRPSLLGWNLIPFFFFFSFFFWVGGKAVVVRCRFFFFLSPTPLSIAAAKKEKERRGRLELPFSLSPASSPPPKKKCQHMHSHLENSTRMMMDPLSVPASQPSIIGREMIVESSSLTLSYSLSLSFRAISSTCAGCFREDDTEGLSLSLSLSLCLSLSRSMMAFGMHSAFFNLGCQEWRKVRVAFSLSARQREPWSTPEVLNLRRVVTQKWVVPMPFVSGSREGYKQHFVSCSAAGCSGENGMRFQKVENSCSTHSDAREKRRGGEDCYFSLAPP